MPKTYRTIDAVKKAGEILRFLANQKEPVPGAEIAKAVGLATGTAMCHLATLEELGFVRVVGEGYEIGLGAALLWSRYKSNREALRDQINRELEELRIGG